jgi:hypothetical protein
MVTGDTELPAEDEPRRGDVPGVDGAGSAVPTPRTEGQRRDLGVLVNLRDIGGLPTTDGRRTRTGVLYRSEAPRRGDLPPPAPMLWPPRTVIDLRSAVERSSHGHPLAGDGTAVRTLPLFGEEVGRQEGSRVATALAVDLAALYQAILDVAAPRLVEILHLVAEAPAPLLVHCAAGKDRTGLVVALLLRVAGVEKDAVLADYAATAENMPDVLRRLGENPLLPGATTAVDVTAVSVTAAEQVVDLADGHPGGVRGWFLDRGASEAALDAWLDRILTP